MYHQDNKTINHALSISYHDQIDHTPNRLYQGKKRERETSTTTKEPNQIHRRVVLSKYSAL